jgi:uncharacterized protein YjiS (DUF1127 family)
MPRGRHNEHHAVNRGSAMTMFSDIATTTPFILIRRRFSIFLAQLGRHVNRWIAAAIARRERQAALVVQRHFNDRDLQDIGICRYQVGDALADCEQNRQESRQSELS